MSLWATVLNGYNAYSCFDIRWDEWQAASKTLLPEKSKENM